MKTYVRASLIHQWYDFFVELENSFWMLEDYFFNFFGAAYNVMATDKMHF